jgi:hypothetical protein
LQLTAHHPRLEQPMTVVDLCFFVAEHDDHHLAAITSLRGGSALLGTSSAEIGPPTRRCCVPWV